MEFPDYQDLMATKLKPMTSEAIALTEKMTNMTLDDIIKKPSSEPRNTLVANNNPGSFQLNSAKAQQSVNSGAYRRQKVSELKPMTSEAIALVEEKMNMTLDEIIKESKKPLSKSRNTPVANNNPGSSQGNATNVQQFVNSGAYLRQKVSELKPMTSEAIALVEKKMNMTLDEIIKESKKPLSKSRNTTVANNNLGSSQGNAIKVQQFVNSGAYLRQKVSEMKPMTSEAIAVVEKKMNMTLDEIIKESKKPLFVPRNRRVPNNNLGSTQGNAAKVQQFVNSGAYLRQKVSELKPMTSEAIAHVEKKMNMTLDEIIKESRKASSKSRHRRVSNKNCGLLNGGSFQGNAAKVQQFMDVRSYLRQGVLNQRRSNFTRNQFPLTTEVASKAVVTPIHNKAFTWTWNKPRDV